MSHRMLDFDIYKVGVALAAGKNWNLSQAYDPNLVSRLISKAIEESGLGKKAQGGELAGAIIQPGMTVLLKPNWVLHLNQGGQGMDCMVTHPVFLMEIVKKARTARAGKIIIGDAPLQGCQWNDLVTEEYKDFLREVAHPCPVEFIDFRRTIMRGGNLEDGTSMESRGMDRYALFDLKKDSLLEPISEPEGRFRVTMYDPDKLGKTHCPGRHQYLLCKEPFEADVVINLPKLKTHRKSGMTAALKNLVGMNGNKDYLPHHRVGGTSNGGDCYPGYEPWKLAVEMYLDEANKRINTPEYAIWQGRADALIGMYGRFQHVDIDGGWHGNDTLWRTVLDLNRILVYGRADGTMADEPQRVLWCLTDGIVIGEGDGPLSPSPKYLGAVTFSGSAAASDMVNAALLHLDAERIALLREAPGDFRWPLVPRGHQFKASVNNKEMTLDDVAHHHGVDVVTPRCWRGQCELPMSTQA